MPDFGYLPSDVPDGPPPQSREQYAELILATNMELVDRICGVSEEVFLASEGSKAETLNFLHTAIKRSSFSSVDELSRLVSVLLLDRILRNAHKHD